MTILKPNKWIISLNYSGSVGKFTNQRKWNLNLLKLNNKNVGPKTTAWGTHNVILEPTNLEHLQSLTTDGYFCRSLPLNIDCLFAHITANCWLSSCEPKHLEIDQQLLSKLWSIFALMEVLIVGFLVGLFFSDWLHVCKNTWLGSRKGIHSSKMLQICNQANYTVQPLLWTY